MEQKIKNIDKKLKKAKTKEEKIKILEGDNPIDANELMKNLKKSNKNNFK